MVTIDNSSFLQITARSENFQQGFAYTSGRIHTRKHPVAGRLMPPKNPDGSWVDGGSVRVEARVKLPQGTPSGTWPAFWMLPTDNVRALYSLVSDINNSRGELPVENADLGT